MHLITFHSHNINECDPNCHRTICCKPFLYYKIGKILKRGMKRTVIVFGRKCVVVNDKIDSKISNLWFRINCNSKFQNQRNIKGNMWNREHKTKSTIIRLKNKNYARPD